MTLRKVLATGGSWHGGNCPGLVRGFRALGHPVQLVGSDRYLPAGSRSLPYRALRRLLRPVFVRQFNQAILDAVELFRPDIVVVFKGSHVKPETLARIRGQAWLANFYPDNSFLTHRDLDVDIFQHFDHVFTTKKFGVRDFVDHLGLCEVSFLPHGYDPQVHRPFTDPRLLRRFACDVSFIGTWSPHKERLLAELHRHLEPGQLRIWGLGWEQRADAALDGCTTGRAVLGDLYALAVSASRINLGLLSERRRGAGDDDQITSRTFHIPASGGFLLHERTGEVAEYFEEGREVACFGSAEELVEKVTYYLGHEEERRATARAGYDRCVAENSLAERARVILRTYEEGRTCGNASAGGMP